MFETAQILRKNAEKPQMATPAIDTVLFYTPNVVFTTDYFPFCMTFNNYSNSTNLFKFNGKEEQTELEWLDFGARMYDDQLGRWFVVDPQNEKRFWSTPYNFVQNNPITRIDKSGELDTKYEDEDGKPLYKTEDGNDATVVISKEKKEKFIKDFEDGDPPPCS